MITLYHSIGARSLRCLWALEELQLPYRLEMVEFPPRVKAPAFLEINPIGSLPFFVDGDTRINESAAILEYLSARYDSEGRLSVRPDEPAFGNWLNWIHYGEASLTTPLATIFKYAVGLPKEQRLPAVVEEFKGFFADRLKPVEMALRDNEFLCAGRFTMADISVGYALFLARFLRLETLLDDSVKGYLDRMVARPAFAAAMQKSSSSAA
jgi:glutathione S-transferase